MQGAKPVKKGDAELLEKITRHGIEDKTGGLVCSLFNNFEPGKQ